MFPGSLKAENLELKASAPSQSCKAGHGKGDGPWALGKLPPGCNPPTMALNPPFWISGSLDLWISEWMSGSLVFPPSPPTLARASDCVCLRLSASAYVSASVFVSAPRASVCVCLRLFASVCVCLRLSASVCVCLRLSASVCVCLRLSASVCVCLRLSASVCVCLRLSTYLRLSVSASVCVCLRICVCLRPACLSVSLCVCLCLSTYLRLSVSVYVSASVFLSAKTLPPPYVSLSLSLSLSLCVCLCLSTYLCLSSCPQNGSVHACFLSPRANVRLSSCPRRPSPPLRVCLSLSVSVYVSASLAPGRNSNVCGGGGRRPLNKFVNVRSTKMAKAALGSIQIGWDPALDGR